MSDHQGITDTGTDALVNALREEIVGLEDADETGAPELPSDLRALLALAQIEPRIITAVDDLLAMDEPLSEDLSSRLLTGVAAIQAADGTGLRYLEQVVSHSRGRKDLTVSAVANHLHVTEGAIVDVERGRTAFDALDKRTVADWIRLLGLNVDVALDALRRSLASPATAYGGDTYSAETAEDYVRGVETILRATE